MIVLFDCIFGQIVPSRLQIKCRKVLEMDAPDCGSQTSSSRNSRESASNDLIWYGTMNAVLISLIGFLLSELESFNSVVED